jgi:hypothetical protein
MTQHANGKNKGPSRPRSSIPELKVEHLTLSEALNLGAEASRALRNQSVELALQLGIRQLQNEWADSKPEETKKRDFLYHEIQALKRVYYGLTGFIDQAHNIQAQQQQQEAQYHEESQY